MKQKVGLLLLLCVCLLFVSCSAQNALPEDVLLRVIFLDVGQGDSALLRTREGDILIDAGPDASQETLCRKLEELGVEELILAVFTHPDEDHIGGADGVLSQIPTHEVWLPETNADNEPYERLLDAAQKSGSEVRFVEQGELRQIGDVHLFVFSPMYATEADSNDSSIVLKVTCREASALFMGDASASVEKALLEQFGVYLLSADLYKVGHHGSSTSTSQAFLEAVAPRWAVISCESGNSFGHPHGEVLVRLENAGVAIYRTDVFGDVVFDCDGERFIPPNDND